MGPLFLCCNKTTTNKTKQEHGDASFLSLDELTRDLFADGLHASLEQALEEEVLAVSPTSGKMLGLVALHDPEKDEKAQLRVGGKQLRTELSQRCSYAVDLVGKVYVRFESIGYDYRFGVGTCFKISPSLLLTARRVVPETTWLDVQKQVDGKLQTFRVPFRRKGLHVTFRSSTRLINPRLLSGDEDCHAVTVLPSPQYPKQLAYCFPPSQMGSKGAGTRTIFASFGWTTTPLLKVHRFILAPSPTLMPVRFSRCKRCLWLGIPLSSHGRGRQLSTPSWTLRILRSTLEDS